MSDFDVPAARALCADNEATRELAFVSRTLLPAALDEIERLRKEIDGYAKECREVENALGAALGFPRYCDDKKNFPHATEKDGYCVGEHLPGTLAQAAAAEIERLRAALAAERKACDKYRRGHTHTNRLNDPESCFIMDNGNSKDDLRCDQCRAHDARRAGENK